MDILTVDNRQVVACVHCNGSGICNHADFQKCRVPDMAAGQHTSTIAAWTLTCSKCGSGLPREDEGGMNWKQPPRAAMKGPVCSVCGGRGHLVV
jgi:hypothetical protein